MNRNFPPYVPPSISDSVAIISGGLDSTTLVYEMLEQDMVPHLLSFDYGQRHAKELQYARNTAVDLKLKHDVIDLTGLTGLISNSALTSPYDIMEGRAVEVPDGHYAEETMKATVVPNRNMIMLSIACGVAVNEGATCIGIGTHAGDHFVYPDCRPEFIVQLELAMLLGNEGFHQFKYGIKEGRKPEGFDDVVRQKSANIRYFGNVSEEDFVGPIYAPYLRKSKAAIAYRAIELGVPFDRTWSCYKGQEYHCGRCGTCVERLEAIDTALDRWEADDKNPRTKFDATVYQDRDFWREAVR